MAVLKIVNRYGDGNYLDCKINDRFYTMKKYNAITPTPYYEPHFGWFIAEGWLSDDYELLVITHKVGNIGANEPSLDLLDLDVIEEFDFFTEGTWGSLQG